MLGRLGLVMLHAFHGFDSEEEEDEAEMVGGKLAQLQSELGCC